MERIRLTDPADPRFGEAFALYEISFPVYERRTRAAQAARLSHPEYHFDLLVEGEQFLGILLFWEAEGFRYVEHFATCPQLRGQGVGARAPASWEEYDRFAAYLGGTVMEDCKIPLTETEE